MPDIHFQYIPVRTVCAQSCAKKWLIFNYCRMMKSGHFQPQSLTAPAGAKFNSGKYNLSSIFQMGLSSEF